METLDNPSQEIDNLPTDEDMNVNKDAGDVHAGDVQVSNEMDSDTDVDAYMDESPNEKTALTIHIHSWATPIVGLVMLVIGLGLGYFGRPFLTVSQSQELAAAPKITPASQAVDPAAGEAMSQEAAPESTPTLMEFLIGQTRHFKGNPDAPVTFIEFSDYQCPYCGKFAAETAPQIDETYVSSGKVRFGYWHFTFLGPESQWAAEASECASDQDAFWEYHDLLFSSQSGENQGAFNKDNLKKFAAGLGLDTQAFDECLDSGKYTDVIKAQTATAQSLGVTSTPAMVINGQPIIGAQPFTAFQQVIDQKLSEAQP